MAVGDPGAKVVRRLATGEFAKSPSKLRKDAVVGSIGINCRYVDCTQCVYTYMY